MQAGDFLPVNKVRSISAKNIVSQTWFVELAGFHRCSFGIRRSISWISNASPEVVNDGFEDHFAEFMPPPSPTTAPSVRLCLRRGFPTLFAGDSDHCPFGRCEYDQAMSRYDA